MIKNLHLIASTLGLEGKEKETKMQQKEIFELYRNLKRGFDTSNWDLIQESMDYLSEYIELNDDDETLDELKQ